MISISRDGRRQLFVSRQSTVDGRQLDRMRCWRFMGSLLSRFTDLSFPTFSAIIFKAARRPVRSIAIAGVLLLLGACTSLPGGTGTAKSKPKDAGSTQAQQTGEAPTFEFDGPEQNPYLTQEVSVPRAAQQLFGQAVSAMTAQQWQEAELLLKQLTQEYPALSGPFVNLGIVYRDTKRPNEAEEAFKAAIAANPLNLDAYNQLAFVEREQGNFKAAEENYLSALKVWPRHATSHKNIGILYDLHMGQWDKALDHFKKYQFLAGEDDKLIAGWVIDLQRRIDAGK